jgi:DNA-binding response OmpR family regulator
MKIACHIQSAAVYEQVSSVLARAGFDVQRFASETALLRGVRRDEVDLVLVDLASEPDADNSLLSWLNMRTGDATPVMVLSPMRSADLVAQVLNAGADEFLPRPFEAVELMARTNALLRRSGKPQQRRSIDYAGYSLERDSGRLHFLGQAIELTPREFSMAWLFFSSPGVYISRTTIGAVIWSTDSEVAGRTIEQHVYKLRKKLQVGDKRIVMIRTAYTQGYRLELCTPE